MPGPWYANTTWDPKTMDPANAAPAASTPEPEPAPVPEPEETTLVDEHPPVADESHDSEAADEDHHEEHDAMTEDEISETPTEEPDEFWSAKRVAIGGAAVLLVFVIVVSASSGHPYVLGLLSLGFLGALGLCVLKVIKGNGKTNRLAFAVGAILAFIFMVVCWMAMAKGSAPVGPYGP